MSKLYNSLYDVALSDRVTVSNWGSEHVVQLFVSATRRRDSSVSVSVFTQANRSKDL